MDSRLNAPNQPGPFDTPRRSPSPYDDRRYVSRLSVRSNGSMDDIALENKGYYTESQRSSWTESPNGDNPAHFHYPLSSRPVHGYQRNDSRNLGDYYPGTPSGATTPVEGFRPGPNALPWAQGSAISLHSYGPSTPYVSHIDSLMSSAPGSPRRCTTLCLPDYTEGRKARR